MGNQVKLSKVYKDYSIKSSDKPYYTIIYDPSNYTEKMLEKRRSNLYPILIKKNQSIIILLSFDVQIFKKNKVMSFEAKEDDSHNYLIKDYIKQESNVVSYKIELSERDSKTKLSYNID